MSILLYNILGAKGDVFGAHFCYLAIQIPLESIGLSSKYILLGTSSNQIFNTMATNRTILLTSAYEYSMKLNNNYFHIPSLLVIYSIILYNKFKFKFRHLFYYLTFIHSAYDC